MTTRQAGQRIGAVLAMGENEVRLLGYGTYDGDFAPPSARDPSELLDSILKDEPNFLTTINSTREQAIETLKQSPFFSNPRMTLDNGDTVWGNECWWGPEEAMKGRIGSRTVVNVRIKRDQDGNPLGITDEAGNDLPN